jgi:hypothetical protein
MRGTRRVSEDGNDSRPGSPWVFGYDHLLQMSSERPIAGRRDEIGSTEIFICHNL